SFAYSQYAFFSSPIAIFKANELHFAFQQGGKSLFLFFVSLHIKMRSDNLYLLIFGSNLEGNPFPIFRILWTNFDISFTRQCDYSLGTFKPGRISQRRCSVEPDISSVR